jgi:hypothetical protein
MARESLAQRVDRAFPERRPDEFTLFYLGAILDARTDIFATARRSGLLMIGVIVASELLLSDKVDELSLLGTKITDVAATRALGPAVLAYLAYEQILLILRSNALTKLRDHVVRRMYPELAATKLHQALGPGVLSLWGGPDWHLEGRPGRAARARHRLDYVLGVTLVLGIWVYIYTVYHRLLDREGGEAVVVLSTCFALLMLIRAMLVMVDEGSRMAARTD